MKRPLKKIWTLARAQNQPIKAPKSKKTTPKSSQIQMNETKKIKVVELYE